MANLKKPGFPASALVATDNADVASHISTILKSEYGVDLIKVVGNGEEAWSAAKSEPFEFVIYEWKIDKFSGVVLFNRLKLDEKYQTVPVLVLSKVVPKENFVILRDYPLVGLADGAFSPQSFSVKFELLAEENIWYQSNAKTLDTIATFFKDDPNKAQTQLITLVKTSPNAIPILNLAAKKFREFRMFETAEFLLNDARILNDNSTSVMELAKIYLLTGRSKEAIQLIQSFNFSMKNIEHFLLEGEGHLNEKNPDEAKKKFSAALDLDPGSEAAKSGVLIADNLKTFSAQLQPHDMSLSFASLMNLVGITLVKSGKHDEGVGHYKAAMDFIHDDPSTARLMFNVGLAFVRKSDKAQALTWFKQSEKLGGDIFTRAKDLLKALEKNPNQPIEDVGGESIGPSDKKVSIEQLEKQASNEKK